MTSEDVHYRQDDIVRGLRASLLAVLATSLASERANDDFLKGVFAITQSQAALYGIPWIELVESIRGTPEFDKRVGAWISAWVEHWKSKGISPDRIVIHGHDEPRGEAGVKSIVAWVKAIRAAAPEVLHWSDPVYREPAKAPRELFEAFDILCPNRPMWLSGGPDFARFYRDQQTRGGEIQTA